MSKNSANGFHLLIPAAGTASRMGQVTPKPYMQIQGKAILRHTIEKFSNIKGLKGIQVVIHPDHRALYDMAIEGLNLPPPIIGSNSRKLSIYNGLQSFLKVLHEEIVLIHDAARPLVEIDDIQKLLKIMQNSDAATLASPVTDTLVRGDENVDRDSLWAIQTPQAFKIGPLKEAHEKFANDDNFTDDAGLMRAMGHKVEIVPASRNNIKITTAEDFEMVQAMMAEQTETRTATGYDVHAFEKAHSDRKLMLGGIELPHDVALTGHSDADVILHAITDAILGTINEGDIGTHFPPSDPQWKNADSALFLKKAGEMLLAKGGSITLLDVTILAEEPKIGPHRDAMQKRIAGILNISSERISIKATTTEQLGFVGRKEGMACQALATITLPVRS